MRAAAAIKLNYFYLIAGCIWFSACTQQPAALVFQTDFGVEDGAVSAMKGVAYGVDKDIRQFDLTHEIPAYDIWASAYRLHQAAAFWPKGTVFVSVVDPGVGTTRKSIVAKSRSGHYFVTPDNGTLTLIALHTGLQEVREIDESVNRRVDSYASHTFHGRDVYAFTGARLAAGKISFEELGSIVDTGILVKLSYKAPQQQADTLKGTLMVTDSRFGNIWSDIPGSMLEQLGVKHGELIQVRIYNKDQQVHSASLPFVHTFGEVQEGQGLAYLNSLLNFSLALNMGSYTDSFGIKNGPDWTIRITKQTKAIDHE